MMDIKEKMREFNQVVREQNNEGLLGYSKILKWIDEFKREMGAIVASGSRPSMPADMVEPLSPLLRELALKGLIAATEQTIQEAILRVAGTAPERQREWSCER